MDHAVSNAEMFLDAFNQIEKILNNRFRPGLHVGFTELIRRMQSQDGVIRQYASDLREFAELRNAIVHNRRENYVIAEPHEDIVREIIKIKDLIINPPTLKMLPSKSIFTIPRRAPLSEVLKVFAREGFTRCPVVDEGHVVGLLTARSIVRWMASSSGMMTDLKLALVENVMPWAAKERFVVVRPSTQLHAVYELFTNQLREGGSLQAVLITSSGKPLAPIQGIVTASDLPGVFKLLSKD